MRSAAVESSFIRSRDSLYMLFIELDFLKRDINDIAGPVELLNSIT